MKTSAVLIAGSLLLNAALAVMVLRRPMVRDFFVPTSDPAAAAPTSGSSAASASAPSAARAGVPSAAASVSWADLTHGELPDVVARMRAQGVPPQLVLAIVRVLVTEKFAERHRGVVAAMTARPWWDGLPYEPYGDVKATALRRGIEKEERAMVYDLLGPETPRSEYDRLWRERRYGLMPPEQIERLRRINLDYNDLIMEAREQAKEIILPQDRQKLAYLEEEKRKDIDKLLTPDERLEFDLRSSPTSRRLRTQLAAFEPTEEEFRAIFKIHAAIDARFGGGTLQNLTQEERRQRRDAVAGADAQIKGVLSPERFAAYEAAARNPVVK